MISPSELAALRARVEELETTTPEAPETPDLDPLRQQIGELEEQIASLASSGAAEGSDAEPAPVDLTPMMSRLDALAERLTAVDERVAALEARLRTATAQQVSPADLAAVRERLNSVTDAVSDNAALLARTRSQLSELQNADIYEAESMMLSLAVSRVRQAVEAGQPYAASLSALERFARASGSVPIEVQDALDTLKPTAEDGVASARELAESFERAAPRIIDAADVPPGGSWWQRTLANLRDVVTVRRVGDLEGDTVESIVARAEQAVEAGRIEQAVNELKTLEGGALEAAQVWIDEAEARQTALAALDGLDAPGPDAAAP